MIKRLILCTIIRDKRQANQRIFQPFRLVNSDNFHQMLIAFESHLLTCRITVWIGNMLRQPAHQRVFTFQLRTGLLQQFADVQNVSQTPLTTGCRQHIFSDVALRHQFTQHGHDAAL
ncbi:hypothetical protein D3C80_1094280 [compost metagenome]